MQILEISCQKFMCFERMHLNLTNRKCSIITCAEPNIGTNALITAIRFIIDPSLSSVTYKELFITSKRLQNKQESYVKIKFVYCEQDNSLTTMTAIRSFLSIDKVVIRKNDEQSIIPIRLFQKLFATHPTLIYPFVNFEIDLALKEENLLSYFSYDRLSSVQNIMKRIYDFDINQLHNLDVALSRRNVLLIFDKLYDLYEFEHIQYARMIVTLTYNVNNVFKKLTKNIYSIRFIIKTDDGIKDLTADLINSESFKRIITLVKIKKQEILWTSVPDDLKLLLQVATKIAVAVQFNYRFVFIDNLHKLTLRQMILEKLKDALPSNEDIDEKNFLQNIVDYCEHIGLQAFLKCDNTFTIKNCNILFCGNTYVSPPAEPHYYVTVTDPIAI